MKKTTFTIALLFFVQLFVAQKAQTVAYIDMDYILENVPEYVQAQNTLNEKVVEWKQNLSKLERNIEVLKTDLTTEKAILTKDIIEEKEEDILIKQEELIRLESLYFGPNGDLFQLRKQLVEPVQDQVYNAVQDIAKRKNYDFVFDKSSELVMLYFNKKYDISELVLATIVRDKKISDSKDRAALKKEEIQARADSIKKARLEKIEAQKKAIQEKKDAKIKEREEKRKELLERKNATKKNKEVEVKEIKD